MSVEVSPLSIVGAVRNSLHAVTAFSIVKELLQNADDCGAQRWALGSHPGLPDARHPLLRGPALYVANDGAFRPEDAAAICQLHVSGKAGDSGSIGKFGLGLKSVYQLCEAFFYFANAASSSDGAAGVAGFSDRYPPYGVLSPWLLRNDHPDNRLEWRWPATSRPTTNTFGIDPDLALVSQAAAKAVGWRGFTLWIPLRLTRHTELADGRRAHIHTEMFDGDGVPNDIFNTGLERNLRRVAPLLRNVRSFRVIGPDEGRSFNLEVSGGPGPTKRTMPVPRTAPNASISNATVRFAGHLNGASHSAWYAGVERGVNGMLPMREMQHWPSATEQTETHQQQVPDKTVPHAAVVLVAARRSTGSGTLDVGRAVFLPLSDRQDEHVPLDVDFDVHLTLHGYYFLSPDRTSIRMPMNGGAPAPITSEGTLMEAWNARLDEEATHPLVLDALRAFELETRRVDHDAARSGSLVAAITRAIQNSRLFAEHRFAICLGRSWVRRWDATGLRTWCLLDPGAKVLVCPDARALFRLAPNAAAVLASASASLTEAADPALMPSVPQATWDPQLLEAIVRAIDVDAAATADGMADLVTFLRPQLAHESTRAALAPATVPLLRELTAKTMPRANDDLSDSLVALLDLVPSEHRFAVPRKTHTSVLESLRRLDAELVIHPDAEGLTSSSRLAPHVARQFLLACEGGRDTDELILRVLEASQEPIRVLETIRDLEVLPARVSGVDASISYASLLTAANEGWLLDREENQFTFVPRLQACLEGVALVQVTSRLSRLIDLTPATGTMPTVLKLLARRPPLTDDPRPRVALLAAVLSSGATMGNDDVSRYLLHRRSDLRGSTAPLHYQGPHHATSATITQKVLHSTQEGWRWIGFGSLLEEHIPTQRLRSLGIRAATDAELMDLLATLPTPKPLPHLEQAEYDYLLHVVDDVALAQSLPMHETTRGDRVALDDAAVLESDFLLGFHGDRTLFDDLNEIRVHPTLVDRQRRLGLRPLDPSAVLARVMDRDAPVRYWREAIGALPKVDLTRGELRAQVSQRAWLPARDGSAVAPMHVLHVPELSETVTPALLDTGTTVTHFDALDEDVRSHPNAAALHDLLPKGIAAIELLGAALAPREAYRVGELDQLTALPEGAVEGADAGSDEITATEWLAAFGPATDAVPLTTLLGRLDEQSAAVLWHGLLGPIDAARCCELLRVLRERHRHERMLTRRNVVQAVHDAYLALAATTPNWSIDHPSVRLLARSGTWRAPAELTHGDAGVDPSFIVCENHARVLDVEKHQGEHLSDVDRREVLPRSGDEWCSIEQQLGATADELETYFASWAGRVKPELIGGLLALLGDDPRMRDLAKRYLGGFSVDAVRDGLEVPIAQTDVLRNEPNTLAEKIQVNRFAVVVERGTTLIVRNLLGERIEVLATTEPDSLLAGRPEYVRRGHTFFVGLRFLPPGASDGQKLRRLIRETARMCLKSVYNRPDARLDDLFGTLDESEQLDLAVVQDRCLNAAEHYLRRQLGARSPELDPYIAAITNARVAQSERRVLSGDDGHAEAEQAEREALLQLRSAIEQDDRVHAATLGAVRRKVEQYQYRPSSVPFELLQNADDALAERRRLDPYTALDTRFVVNRTERGFEVMHWGRQINRGERSHDHHRDLEKMLTLSASDKGSESVGRFGLGFKSVFLISDRPAVLSQDLAFSVVGGFYPMRLGPTETQRLRSRLEQFGDRSGTLIELETPAAVVDDALDRFEQLAPYLLLFAHNVRCIELGGTSATSKRIEPRRHATDVPHLSVVDLPPPTGRIAMFGSHDFGIAIRVGIDGFETVANDVPRVWVTTPTAEQARFGFLVFGNLDLDVGRQKLAADAHDNARRARALASNLYASITHLHNLTSDARADVFGPFARNDAAFWGTLFDALSEGFEVDDILHTSDGVDATHLARTALWGHDGALRRALSALPVLPTGLPQPFDQPTRLDAIRTVARRPLDDATVFTGPATTPAFHVRHPPGKVVAARVSKRLDDLGLEVDATDLGLASAFRAAVGEDALMTPDLASHLGPWWNNLTDAQRREISEDSAGSPLSLLMFRSSTGAYHPTRAMVGPNDLDDVRMLVPEKAILALEYTGPGLELFEAARRVEPLDPVVVAGWVLSQTSDVGRTAAVRFLLGSSIQSWHVISALRSQAAGSWLNDANAIPTAHARHHLRLRALLGLPIQLDTDEDDDVGDTGAVPGVRTFADGAAMLQWIAERWAAEHERRIQRYERSTFPWPLDRLDAFVAEDLDSRRSWLTLLLLGALHALGRQRREQHRSFLSLCEERNWFGTFAEAGSPSTQPAEQAKLWLSVIDEYLDPDKYATDDQYRLWMGQFVNIYQLSNWLDTYVHLLSKLDSCRTHDEILQIWKPAEASVLTGSGIIAPPLHRVLRLGKHFVIRELLRRGVLAGPLLDEYAFVPSVRLRALWQTYFRPLPEDHGEASRTIHREARAALGTEGARFDGAYDLAFDVLFDEEEP